MARSMVPSVLDDLGEEITGIAAPVSICMAIVVALVRALNPEGASDSVTVYIASMAYSEQPGDSAGQKLGGALLNGIIFVCVIAAMTFVLFLLFKYRCYKVIYGYMGFAVFDMYFVLTGAVLLRVLQVAGIHLDWVTVCLCLFNFSVVGVVGLFFAPVPLFLKQAYLVWTGVVTAFMFTYIPEWTSWVLLGLMAIYDLIAVLAPGGPLKVLVELAIERDQELPALVYEARPSGGRPYRRGWGGRGRTAADGAPDGGSSGGSEGSPSAAAAAAGERGTAAARGGSGVRGARRGGVFEIGGGGGGGGGGEGSPSATTALLPASARRSSDASGSGSGSGGAASGAAALETGGGGAWVAAAAAGACAENGGSGGALPGQVPEQRGGVAPPGPAGTAPRPRNGRASPPAVAVAARDSGSGGGMQPADGGGSGGGGAHGPGAVVSVEEEEGSPLPDAIKLGLGDFIFYSMLVGRAAMYDMMTVFASFLAIVAGLGITLLLLALARKALPALPVSIALGVAFYFLTRLAMEPFAVPLALNGVYY